MKKIAFTILLFLIPFTLTHNNLHAQNSGERYVACGNAGCAIIGNQFCGIAYYLNGDGTVTTYWCVLWVVEGEPVPEVV